MTRHDGPTLVAMASAAHLHLLRDTWGRFYLVRSRLFDGYGPAACES